MPTYEQIIARKMLSYPVTRFNTEQLWDWTSGIKSPIYNDLRLFIHDPENRKMVADGFIQLIRRNNIEYDIISGTVSAAVPPATTLADQLNAKLIYVKKKQKEHGTKKRIEGVIDESEIGGKKILQIEDAISTGGSSLNAMNYEISKGAIIEYCLTIYDYELPESQEAFENNNPRIIKLALVRYQTLIQEALEMNRITEDQLEVFKQFRADPRNFGK